MKIDETLIRKYIADQCSAAEAELIEAWFASYANDPESADAALADIVGRLDKRVPVIPGRIYRLRRWKIGIAAACLLMIGSVLFYQYRLSTQLPQQFDVAAPVSAHAVIVTQDNREISLDSIRYQDTIHTGHALITKNEAGEIVYLTASGDDGTPIMNTLRTAVGGVARLKLPDGSHMWLNSNAEVEYPVRFGPGSREVRLLRGEAYFEVAPLQHNGVRETFMVRSADHRIVVLGTRFNVRTAEKTFSAAVLEGKVAISELAREDRKAIVLRPRDAYTNGHLQHDVDVQSYIDWKEGYFNLTGLTLLEITDKLHNWYGIPFVIDPAIQEQQYFGAISKSKKLSQVLHVLAESSDVVFRVTPERVFVNKVKSEK